MHSETKTIRKALPAIVLVDVTLFIFGTLEMWFGNRTEFWFSIGELLFPCIATALLAGLVMTGVVWTLGKLSHGKIMPVLISLLFSCGVAAYLQGNFLTIDYGLLDGKTIDWSQYTVYGVIDTLVWALCFAVPLVLLRVRRKWFDLAVKWVPVYILAIQVVTLGTLFLTHDVSQKESAIFTTEHEFELSKDKNVVVFIVDTLDAQYVECMLQQYPEVKTSFADFTFFNDAVGAYPTTRGGVPYILTGIPNFNEQPVETYLLDAYQNSPILNTAKENGWEIDAYSGDEFAAPTEDVFTNLKIAKTYVNDLPGFLKTYYQLTAFRYAPHYAKRFLWLYSGDFNQYEGTDFGRIYLVDKGSNNSFYEDLMDNGIAFNRETPVLKIYHLFGSHGPYTIDEWANSVEENQTDVVKVTRGCFRIIEEYLDKLKEAGRYDSTSVVIMGDHGAISFNQNPAVLVKLAGARNAALEINEAPVSYLTNWVDTLLGMMRGDEAYPNSMLHVPEDANVTRPYYYYVWDDGWEMSYLPNIHELRFQGKARDLNEQKEKESQTGNIYRPGATEERYAYRLGDVISGDERAFRFKAIRYGVIFGIAGNVLTFEDNVKIDLSLNRQPKKNLMLHFDLDTVCGYTQEIEVRVNGSSVGKMLVTKGEETADFLIPARFVDSKEITLELLAPGADTRMYSVPACMQIRSFQLAETDETMTPEKSVPTINEDTTIEIKDGELHSKVQIRGQWQTEQNGVWSSDVLSFKFNTDRYEDMTFSMGYIPFHQINALLTFNGHEITHFTEAQRSLNVVLPKEYLSEEGPQEILIRISDAKSPSEIGENEDKRVIGLMLQEASIRFLDDMPVVNEDVSVTPTGGQTQNGIYIIGLWPEQDGETWSKERFSILFKTDVREDILFSMKYSAFDDLNATILYNDHELASFCNPHGDQCVILPAEEITEDGYQTVEVYMPNAQTEKAYGVGEGERVLGMKLEEVSLCFADTSDEVAEMYKERIRNSWYLYRLGDIIGTQDDALRQVFNGTEFLSTGEFGVIGDGAQMELRLNETPQKNLKLHFDLYTVYSYEQEIGLTVNGVDLGKTSVTKGDKSLEFLIPADVVQDSALMLEFETPFADETIFGRSASFAFTQFQIMQTDEEQIAAQEIPTLQGDVTVTVRDSQVSDELMVRGLWPAENDFAWSAERLSFQFDTDIRSDMKFSITYNLHADFDAMLTFNGQEIARLEGGKETAEFILPVEYLNDDGPQEILIYGSNAKSPSEIGENGDGRVLGLMFRGAALSFIQP